MAGITVLDNLCERFYRTGQRCLADRDYRGAITEFTKVLNGLPHHRGAHYLLAKRLLRFGRVEEAIATLQKMRRLFPADPRVALALGRLLMKTDRKAEGIEALERAL